MVFIVLSQAADTSKGTSSVYGPLDEVVADKIVTV
jgi:hypothetical protein